MIKQHCAIGQRISISSYSCKWLEYCLQNRVAYLPVSTFVCWCFPSKLFQSMTFVFFVAGNCRDLGWQQRYARFCGRIIVLSVLVLLLYPFLWVWTVIGTLWFSTARGCVSFIIVIVLCSSPIIQNFYLTYTHSICSYPRKDKNGASLYGCFSATVVSPVLHVWLLERYCYKIYWYKLQSCIGSAYYRPPAFHQSYIPYLDVIQIEDVKVLVIWH